MIKKIWEVESFTEYRELNSDFFKNHIAKYLKLQDGNDCIIEFAIPDARCGYMRFIYSDGVLTVTGDYGYSVFNWYNKKNHILAYLNFKGIGYAMGKCVAFKNDDVYGFDADLFHSEFEQFIADRKEEGYIKSDYDFDVPYCEDENDVINHFKNAGDKYGEDLYETGAFRFGTYMKERPYIWWHGLFTAIEQLEKDGVFA